jgi:hypothetical protein
VAQQSLFFVNEIGQTFCELLVIKFWFFIAPNCKVHTNFTSVADRQCFVLCWSRVQASATSVPNFTFFSVSYRKKMSRYKMYIGHDHFLPCPFLLIAPYSSRL